MDKHCRLAHPSNVPSCRRSIFQFSITILALSCKALAVSRLSLRTVTSVTTCDHVSLVPGPSVVTVDGWSTERTIQAHCTMTILKSHDLLSGSCHLRVHFAVRSVDSNFLAELQATWVALLRSTYFFQFSVYYDALGLLHSALVCCRMPR
jgi:hypothetical protein